MAVALGVFAGLILLLESGGLYDWAHRLELGPERDIALPVANALHQGMTNFGIEGQRRRLLLQLARIGWSDDPAMLAAVKDKPAAASVASSIAKSPSPSAPGTPLISSRTSTNAGGALKPLAGDPPLNSTLPPIALVAAGGKRTVALAGDSMMAVGLASTVQRQAPRYKDIVLISAFKSGTGLARPEVYDWQQQYPPMLKGVKPDVILVAIGANDGQGFVVDGVTYPFGTEGWQAIYRARVEAYLKMLQSDGATVVWLGLPPMKSDAYNTKIALVNRIAYTVVSSSPHAIWFSTSGTVGDQAGQFRDYGDVDHRTQRLRQSDGIHLSDDGAALVIGQLLPWLAAQEVKSPQPASAGDSAQPPPKL